MNIDRYSDLVTSKQDLSELTIRLLDGNKLSVKFIDISCGFLSHIENQFKNNNEFIFFGAIGVKRDLIAYYQFSQIKE